MRVLTADEMRLCDARAIEHYGIPGAVLMETAGRAVAHRGLELLAEGGGHRALVLAGAGNNGGDGFVAARYLLAQGVDVRVVCAKAPGGLKGDAALYHGIFVKLGGRVDYVPGDDDPLPEIALQRGDLVVDAIFGTGLTREVTGRLRRLVEAAGAHADAGARVLAVDIPSGLSADTGQVLGVAVRADVTVTFGYLKRGLVLFPGATLAGEVEVADIGLPPQVESSLGAPCELLEEDTVSTRLPGRPAGGHKGTFGHVLVVAGSPDKPGAAALTCLGALRGGAGLVTLATRPGGEVVVRARLPEVMGLGLPGAGALGMNDLDAIIDAAAGKDCVALGPGIERSEGTGDLIAALLRELEIPVVLDADGLNALVGRVSEALDGPRAPVVITPHPGEMARLVGLGIKDLQADRLGVAGRFAEAHGVHVLLKGARTVLADPDGALAVNPTGNPGMATGGTGDLLTGLVAALLAQGVPTSDAIRVAAYAHGLAGDLMQERRGRAGLIATDLAEGLCEVWSRWSS